MRNDPASRANVARMADPDMPAPHLSWPARLRFASGDFACNLYWQSSGLFLFFYYTEVLHLAPQVAGVIYMAGSVWDGVADLLTGIWAEQQRRDYGRIIAYAAVPLGLAFPLLYFVPPFHGVAFVAVLLIAQFAFRSLYALVNIPYAAWSARISTDSRDRAAIAGLRMLFGTTAAVVVSLATERISRAVSGADTSVTGFMCAAALFSLVATALLIHVARRSPQGEGGRSSFTPATPLRHGFAALAANRAFVTLCTAMMCVAIASTMLSRSVLYYFTYVIRDEVAGTTALALMGVAGSLFVPLWMLARHRIGSRAVWLCAVVLGVAGSTAFAFTDSGAIWRADLFLFTMQGALAAFSFVFWAMLPDTVEYGEYHGGVRVEALSFGVAALLQKVAIGAATAMTGFAYAAIGYAPQAAQSPGVISGIRWIMVAAPILGCLLSALAMIANPLRRETHARIVASLRRGGPNAVR
ncbi:glycoside-pentoside-hexuronide (GPH):cation symporter [Sphingomonas sp. AR_OL41]|uniref:MFS transporter n=1 Tax=Sphingomonas sp. AR_OL41 TaxID=3042729 RepID=UPI00247FC32C|nr:glycoside-pentoside-hexuronide (GPH):cation symporter [Sphingomonas sp. AR_OL41]MDH7972877.1 glycoside-pentoside-hexuronide (GPH):cation symporter [Sphingomonas sp. AR_OL41]